ncbi:beta-propeller domain-containing protein [Saccharothrix mutabilis subsp. mutabilis]|uniref:Beta-propeller domain-containing protein n=1 Tax=Saccharothrix mutabilis subsp. mutabilis TaxID=66855 RepID=A0ABN0TS18_9PSEU
MALVGGAALVVGVAAASAVPSAFDVQRTEPVENVPVELVAFDTCGAALDGLRGAAKPHVGVYGFGNKGFLLAEGDVQSADARQAAPPQTQQGKEHSTTNVHEQGVDEPDLVKTDGNRVVSVVDGKLRVVDVASRALTGTLDLPAGFASQLLVRGDRALVVAGSTMVLERGVVDPGFAPEQGSTITLVDLKETKVIGSLTVNGRYLDARQIGDVVRVVVHSGPRLPWVYPDGTRSEAEALIRNREIAATAPLEAWLPQYELTENNNKTSGTLVACERVSHPEIHSGTSMLSVLTFDFPGDLGTGDAVSILADGDTVYATDKSLYVADDHHLAPDQNRRAPGVTAIHQFDIAQPGPPKHVASGQVTGSPLNQYSLSEHDGHLRIATTANNAAGIPEQPPASQSAVSVLKKDGAILKEVGKVDGLGIGERIYSVRFVGPVGYVVTFRQTDPLYTLDLSDPAKPRKVGELKITGYSSYLHPAGDGRLIGVGQEADDQGRVQGTQVSLFDVSDAANPKKVAGHHLPGGHSEVEFDPHAFLHWKDLVVVPVMTYATREKPVEPPTSGVLVLRLQGNTFTEVGTVRQQAATGYDGVRRAFVVGDDLWTASTAGLQVSKLDGLAQQAWIPFT